MIDANQLQQLIDNSGELIHRFEHSHPPIEVRELEGIRWLHQGSDATQTAMLLSQPHALILPYTHAMLLALCIAPNPNKILNLGLGGGMFVRFFQKMMPKTDVISIDNHPDMPEILQRYFFTATDTPVTITDAKEFVSMDTNQYNLILCDLFNGNSMPAFLFTNDFYQDCEHRLHKYGVISINVLGVDEETLTALLINLRRSLPYVALIQLTDFKNIILLASKQPFPSLQDIKKNSALYGRQYDVNFTSILSQLIMLPDQFNSNENHS